MACSLRELRRLQPRQVAHQGVRLPRDRAQGALHLHPVRRGLVPARLPGRGDHRSTPPPAPRSCNEATCVGCKVCTIACPFGTINYVHDTGKVQKCDLCGGDPACAERLPDRRHHLHRRRLDRARPDAASGPARLDTPAAATRTEGGRHAMGWQRKVLRVDLTQGHVQVRAAQHGVGAGVPRPARPGDQVLRRGGRLRRSIRSRPPTS